MEEITHLSNTILLPIVVQVYGFTENRKSWKIKNLNHHKEESNKNGWVEKFTERSLSRTQHGHIQNTVKHLRWSLLRTRLNIFAKSSILGADYMVDNFSQGWNFKLLNRDDGISSRMLSDNNRIRIVCKNFITVNQAEIFIACKRVENNHVINN